MGEEKDGQSARGKLNNFVQGLMILEHTFILPS